MVDIENQLSAAIDDRVAGLVAATDLAERARRGGRRRRRAHSLAVAAGAVIAIGAVAAIPMLTPSTPAAPASRPLRPTGPPRFVVAATTPVVNEAPAPSWTSAQPLHPAVRPVVLDALTGRVLHPISVPPGLSWSWSLVAAAPDDRTFVLSARTAAPQTSFSFYRVHLDEDGRPSAPTLIPGSVSTRLGVPRSIALSPDATQLAYSSDAADSRQITIIDVATGRRHAWSEPRNGLLWSASWAPDGHRLAFTSEGQNGVMTVRILDTTRPGSDLTAASSPVPGLSSVHTNVWSVTYCPDGTCMIANGVYLPTGSVAAVQVAYGQILRIPLAGGSPVELARSGLGRMHLSLDGTGRYLIYTQGQSITRLDLNTGQTRKFTPAPSGTPRAKTDALYAAW
ncbi:MAG: hypothetical protein JWN52_6822 [Actinomycetia bacterium]|nr:hypothetical protein [Actinomycetes bacterium]